jgi:hypothetical protein
MDRGKLPGDLHREPLPDRPELALFVATLFQRLGGTLEIDRIGRRHLRRPNPELLDREGLPQLADTRPWEKFRSHAEWNGAMKLAEYWLDRLSAADKEYVFTLLAATPSVSFDFRDQL